MPGHPMRRQDKAITDPGELEAVLLGQKLVTLAMCRDGEPYLVTMDYGYDTEVIVASVRHPLHVVEAALAGADIVTIPNDVFEKMFKHPFTDKGLDAFLADWEKVKGR